MSLLPLAACFREQEGKCSLHIPLLVKNSKWGSPDEGDNNGGSQEWILELGYLGAGWGALVSFFRTV